MIRYAKESDVAEIHALRRECFGDKDGYTSYYARELYQVAGSLLYEKDGKIASVLDLRPHRVQLGERRIGAFRICGFATSPTIGTPEMEQALFEKALDMCDRQVLLTYIDESFEGMYEPFGFQAKYFYQEYEFPRKSYPSYGFSGVTAQVDIEDLNDLYRRFTSHFQGYYISEANRYENILKRLEYQRKNLFTYYHGGKLEGYYIAKLENDTIRIEEIMYDHGEALARMLAHAADQRMNVVVRCSSSERFDKIIPFAKHEVKRNMVVRVNDQPLFRKCFQLRKDESFNTVWSYKPLYMNEMD